MACLEGRIGDATETLLVDGAGIGFLCPFSAALGGLAGLLTPD